MCVNGGEMCEVVDCEVGGFGLGAPCGPWPCLPSNRASLAGLQRRGVSDLETDVQLEAIPNSSKRQTDIMMTFRTYLSNKAGM